MTAAEPLPPWLGQDAEPFTDEDLDEAFRTSDADALAEARGHPAAARLEILGWLPADDDQAEMAMARLRRAKRALAEADGKKRSYAATIAAWYETEAKPLQRRVKRYTEALQAYGVAYRQHTHRATLNLPSGQVPTQEQKPSVELEEGPEAMAALVKWARGFPIAEGEEGLVHTTETVLISELRKVVTIMQVPVGEIRRVTLACGHYSETPGIVSLDSAQVGEVIRCPGCSTMQAVEMVETEAVTGPLVFGPDGKPVPGTRVDPGGIVALNPKPAP